MTFNSFNVSRRSVRSTPQRINKNSEIESHVSIPSCCRRSKHKYIRNNFVEEFHWGQIPTYMAADYKDKKWLHYFVISFIIIHIHTSTLTDSNVHSFAHSSIVRLSTRSFITNIKITFARSNNGLGISRKNINAWKDSRGWINMYMYMNATTNHCCVYLGGRVHHYRQKTSLRRQYHPQLDKTMSTERTPPECDSFQRRTFTKKYK